LHKLYALAMALTIKILFSLALVSPSQAQSTITIGEPSVLTAPDGDNANLLIAQQATLSEAATVDSLSFYVTSAAGELILGIYDASGKNGKPGKLLASTNAFATATGWNTQSVAAPALLAAGTY
jgi:hypothetical protein